MSKTLHRSLEAKLAALEGPEWDSSDEDIPEPETSNKVATKKKTDKVSKTKKDNEVKTNIEDASRVIYLGHLPSEFQEPQILSFLSQFGKVTNVKLSRSERTGNPRGYAFVEFHDEEVATIVAETMSGYFLKGEKRLICHIVPKDKIHPDLFSGSKGNLAMSQKGYTASFHLNKLHDKIRKEVNSIKSEKALAKITKRLLTREKKKREQLKKLGIDYDFPGYAGNTTDQSSTPTISDTKKRKVSADMEENIDEPKSTKKTKRKGTDSKTPTNTPVKASATPKKSRSSVKKSKK
jgi:nucleolar protein 15